MSSTPRPTGALGGVLYPVLFVASLAAGAATAPSGAPLATPYSDEDTARRFLSADPEALHRSLQLSSLLQLLSAIALLAFVPRLADFAGGRRAGLVRVAGTASAVLLALSASTGWVLSMVNRTADLPLARTLLDLTFITGAAPAVGTLGLVLWQVSRTARESRALPSWVAWSGLVLAVASLLSLLSLVAEPATLLIPVGRYLGFVWFAAVGITLWRRDALPFRHE
ncbi:hypothetical protein [Kitasatospora sp. NPDC101183]|uniref:hypothetical protein n=1 Tax=Kitasatospora sp. NPDC101183 TaxID=3364100 RepID=UPI003812DBFC